MTYFGSYKTLIGVKPLGIRYYKVNGFIRVYGGTIYLVPFGPEKYHAICNRIRYLISLKSGITYVFSHNCARMRTNIYDTLCIDWTLTLHFVMSIH